MCTSLKWFISSRKKSEYNLKNYFNVLDSKSSNILIGRVQYELKLILKEYLHYLQECCCLSYEHVRLPV